MTMQYEQFRNPDTGQIAPLRAALQAFNESVLGEYGPDTCMVTARGSDGALCGAIHGWLQFGWLYVNMLWVEDAARRQGVGSALLAQLEAFADARGVRRSRLATSDFQPGHALYLRRGYEVYAQIPIMPDADGEDTRVEYLMWKRW